MASFAGRWSCDNNVTQLNHASSWPLLLSLGEILGLYRQTLRRPRKLAFFFQKDSLGAVRANRCVRSIDVARVSASAAMAGLTTRGLSTDNAVNIAFGLATFVLGVLSILLTWKLARRGRRGRKPTGRMSCYLSTRDGC
jgi:hypothetical protein